MDKLPAISIIILTHGAPEYVKVTLESLHTFTSGGTIPYEVIVLDNASDRETQELLWKCKQQGLVDKLIFESENTYFAKGNNLAAHFCCAQSRYILLLNSDVEIRHPQWLEKLMQIHERGATSYGCPITPGGRPLADGYCFLIDRDLYQQYPIDEQYPWWYGILGTQTGLLKSGASVKAIQEHETYLHHFGGGSGEDWKKVQKPGADRTVYDRELSQCPRQVECIYSLDKQIGSTKDSMQKLIGLSEDGWCEPLVKFNVRAGEQGVVELCCWSPNETAPEQKGRLYANGELIQTFEVCGAFSFRIQSEPNSVVEIRMESDYWFRPSNGDIRQLCFILSDVQGM